jgi:AsmA protein
MPLRRLGIALAILLALFVALLGIGYALLDAETLKGQAVAYVKQHTGWDLAINGPVSLSFVPWLGARMRDVTMRPPEGPPEPLARFETLALKVRLVPLLSQRIEVGGIEAGGGLVRVPGDRGVAYELRNLALETGAFGGSDPTDVSMSFEVVGAGQPPLPLDLTSRMVVDLPREIAELSDMRLRVGESSLEGRVRATQVFRAPSWDAALTSDFVDLDRLLPLLGAASSPSAAPGRRERAAPPPTAHATLQVKTLRAYGLQFSNVEATVDSERGVVVAKPARAQGYGGSADFVVALDGRPPVPSLRAQGGLRRVDLQPLLRDLQQFQNFSGTGDVTLSLSARGTAADRILPTLGGTAGVAITNGRIEGVDFIKMVQQARQLADRLRGRETEAATASGDATSFTRLAATARIANGIARTDDILLESPSLGLTGAGTLNLVQGTLDIVVRATSPDIDTVVPIRISGPIASPRYRLQAGTILKDEALEELQRQLKRRGLGSLFKKPIKN